MVKQKQNKKQLRNEAEWKDVRIRKNTGKSLRLLQIHLDMKTYDDVINYLLSKEASQ